MNKSIGYITGEEFMELAAVQAPKCYLPRNHFIEGSAKSTS